VRYLYNKGVLFEGDADSFAHRQEWANWHDCERTQPPEGHVHSSGKYANLSELGKKCVARYYKEDYELIQELLEKNVCKSNDCRTGLNNILQRRLPLLEEEE
jgi:hypothetical protein